jgi:hypothetical protein
MGSDGARAGSDGARMGSDGARAGNDGARLDRRGLGHITVRETDFQDSWNHAFSEAPCGNRGGKRTGGPSSRRP